MKDTEIQIGETAGRPSRRGFLHGAAALGGLAALGPVLAACSSSTGNSAGSAGTGGKSLKIGMTAALSGPLAPGLLEYTGYMKRVFDKTNAAGGVNGATLDMILMDDGGDSNKALVNARKLVEREGVFAMSVGGTGATSSILPYLVEKKVPLLFPDAYVDTITSPVKPTVFALWQPYDQQIAACVKWGMATKGAGTAVLVFATTSYSAPAQAAAQSAVADAGGQVLKTINTAIGQPEWGSIVIQLKSLKPDYLVLLIPASDAGRLWKEMAQQGYQPPKAALGTVLMTDAAFVSAAGIVPDDFVFGTVPGTVVPSDPAADTIRDLWPGNTLSALGLEGALAADVIIEAVRQLDGDVTQSALVDLLATSFKSYKAPYSTTVASSPSHLMTNQMTVATFHKGALVSASSTPISA